MNVPIYSFFFSGCSECSERYAGKFNVLKETPY